MKAEQVIYTSCRQGIDGNSSGFQNYSYSPQMHDWISDGNGIGAMQAYTPPRRDDYPALPTKEEAQSLYPRRWCFGPLNGPDGLYGMAVCSYIGRDYPQGSVRGGNFISHATALPASCIDSYPCDFLTSPSFLTWMDAETARKEERPAPLTTLDLVPAEDITVDDIREFLDEDDHTDAAVRLLETLIADGEDKFGRKILIDASEHDFMLWVATMQHALPVRQALTYGFSTYEYDPLRSSCVMIRAVDGMNGSASGSCDVFDMESEQYPDCDYDERLDAFAEFVITMLRYSQDGLDSFHAFLDATSYASLDLTLLAAYDLYRVTVGAQPVGELDAAQITACGEFALRYGTSSQRTPFVQCLMRALTMGERSETWCAAAGDVLVKLVQDDQSLRIALRDETVRVCAGIITDGTGSQRLYHQVHAVGERLCLPSDDDIDAEMFRTIDANRIIGDGDGDVHGEPWTVDVYATMVTAAMRSQLDKGLQLPLGVTGEQMVSTFQGEVPAAIRLLVNTIVSQSDPATGITMNDALLNRWQAYPELAVMLSLLVIERKPSTEIEQNAVTTLERVFIDSPTEGRVYCCKSLLSDGRSDIVNRFVDGLAAHIDIYDGRASAHAINDTCDLCKQLGLPVPTAAMLAQQQAAIAGLASIVQERRPDTTALRQVMHAVSTQGAALPISGLEEKMRSRYLMAIARPLAAGVTDSVDMAAVQLRAVPAMFVQTYMRYVFDCVMTDNNAEKTLTLLALDAAMLNADPGTGRAQVERFAQIVGADMKNDASVNTSNLVRLVDDAKKKSRFASRYEKALGKRFPESSFAIAWGKLSPILGPQQTGGIFGFLHRRGADE